MLKRRLATATALALAGGAVLWIAVGLGVQHRGFNRVPIRYIENHDPDGSLSDQPTFWVSNCTDKPIAVRLLAIEAANGVTWTNFYTPRPGVDLDLQFSEEIGKPPAVLAPHTSDEAHLMGFRIKLPTNGVWRVRAALFRKQNSIENAFSAAATGLRSINIFTWRPAHNTIPVPDGSASGRLWTEYKPACEIVSEPVSVSSVKTPSLAEAANANPIRRAPPNAITRAREAMRQTLKPVDNRASAPKRSE